jgi:DNA-binding transcriptional LysR family regulator
LDVPKILGEFHQNYPFVRIRLRHTSSGSMKYLSSIADGSLDLAFISAPDRFPRGVEMRLLSREPMLFVCRPDHPLAQRDRVDVSELVAEDLIGLPSEFGLQRIVEDAFTTAGFAPRIPYEAIVDYRVSANLVRHGLGTMFMPASDASRCTDLRAVPLQPAVDWQIYLAMSANGQLAPASAKLAEMLLASAGEVAN